MFQKLILARFGYAINIEAEFRFRLINWIFSHFKLVGFKQISTRPGMIQIQLCIWTSIWVSDYEQDLHWKLWNSLISVKRQLQSHRRTSTKTAADFGSPFLSSLQNWLIAPRSRSAIKSSSVWSGTLTPKFFWFGRSFSVYRNQQSPFNLPRQ